MIINLNLSNNLTGTVDVEIKDDHIFMSPTIHLVQPEIPPVILQEVLDDVLPQFKNGITTLSFSDVILSYKGIKFSLFGRIRFSLLERLTKRLPYKSFTEGVIHYRWIQPEFLPKFHKNFDSIITNANDTSSALHTFFQEGTLNGTSYKLDDIFTPHLTYDFILNEHLIPIIYSTGFISKIHTDGDPILVSHDLNQELKNFNGHHRLG